jgi:hypothetical protein
MVVSMSRVNTLGQAIAHLTQLTLTQGRKCCLVKIAHCINLNTRNTGAGLASVPMTALAVRLRSFDAEPTVLRKNSVFAF